jgi:dipeptidyl aminopeptidase/acylaminoacyl peptidase
VDGDDIYCVVTEDDSAYLERRAPDGEIVRSVEGPGSVDVFDVRDGKIVYVALRPRKLQELYTVENGAERELSALNKHALAGKAISAPVRFPVTTEDGTALAAWVILPPDFAPGKKYPAILTIHGGPKTAYGEVYIHEMQLLAGEGYIIVFGNPRGSDGRGNAFADIRGKYGTVDYDDLMATLDAAISQFPEIDASHLGVTGGSYGGFMTNWIIGHTDRFAAACSDRSIANWISDFGTTDIGYFFNYDQIGAIPWEDNGEKLWWHSPLRYADRAITPTLFIHSQEDYRCWIAEGIQMFTALRYHGTEARLVMFRGENHDLSRTGKPQHRLHRLQEILAWFDGHLKGSG